MWYGMKNYLPGPYMLDHLIELRKRALLVLLVFAGFCCLYFVFSDDIFNALVRPLRVVLPKNSTLIATHLTSVVLTPLSLAMDFASISTAPVALFHLWRFVLPGLYAREKRFSQALLLASFLLFCLGLAFCFYGVLPFMFRFFAASVPTHVKLLPDMRDALGFISHMLLLFGLSFQLPLLCLALVRLEWLELASLRKIRPYVIVGAFIIGMVLTPPDVFSQISLAIPLCLLYELGILLAQAMATFLKT